MCRYGVTVWLFCSSRRRHTRCALVTGVQTCALPISNIGDVRSLILHPASTTHRQLNDAQLAAAGAGPEVVRLSIGLETVDDIIADLDRALTAAVSRA